MNNIIGLKYIDILVNDIHSSTIATIDENSLPQTRVIDIMLYDNNGIYFLTAKGKAFYNQLMEQKYIALSATKNKIAISLRGRVKNIGTEKLNEIFEKNAYMQDIYPKDTRNALEVFCLYEAQGEYFDISEPKNIIRDDIIIGKPKIYQSGYFVADDCILCQKCLEVCPQRCIDFLGKKAEINQKHCLHCGNCEKVCPKKCIIKR